jgi:hypothetical protein
MVGKLKTTTISTEKCGGNFSAALSIFIQYLIKCSVINQSTLMHQPINARATAVQRSYNNRSTFIQQPFNNCSQPIKLKCN